MNNRQMILLGALGIIALLFVGDWLLENVLQGPLESRRAEGERLQEGIEAREQQLAQARAMGQELEVWESQSLPSDPEVARSLYRAWLLELVGHVGFSNPNVDSGEPQNRRDLFQSVSFSLRGRGNLEQLTQFLFEFYRAGHLHQIRSLAITPMAERNELDLAISIEALVLPTADRQDQLTTQTSNRLAFSSLGEYQPIVARNLFVVGGGLDSTEHTYLTAVTRVNGRPEAWFTVRTEDEVVTRSVGQHLEVGPFAGTIVDIEGSDVVLESNGGQRWLLTVGENLAQASALPPGF